MSKTVKVSFSTQAEKDAAVAEQKEQTLKCDAKKAEELAELESAEVVA